MTRAAILIIVPVLLGLSACSEPSQDMYSNAHHAPAYEGTGSKFMATGWKAGDKTSWEQELKARAQRGQNEYNKTNH